MFSKVLSAAVLGIEGYIVEVESHLEGGLPSFATVGLPDGAVKESKERVNAAIKNSGFKFPGKRITVNLAPADVRKEGSAFDLPMAVGILTASGQIDQERLDGTVILGELALDGQVRAIRGGLSIAVAVRDKGVRRVLVPRENAKETAMAEGLDVFPVGTLEEAVNLIEDGFRSDTFTVDMNEVFSQSARYAVD